MDIRKFRALFSTGAAGPPPPVAVGGVGGSGTRLVARVLSELGFFMGPDLNESNDNLWFTLLFKRREILQAGDKEFDDLVAIFRDAMNGRGPLSPARLDIVRGLADADQLALDAEWLGHRVQSLERWTAERRQAPGPWGWKEPNTHVVLDRLEPLLPGMKYVHVVRNGLDMAYSPNQSQLRVWGPFFLGLECIDATPRLSLKYWRAVHGRVLEQGRKLGDRFLWLNYDKLCTNPEEGLRTLLRFLGSEPTGAAQERLRALVRPPPTIGRFRQYRVSDFDPEDVAFVRDLGFDTNYGSDGSGEAC